MLRENFKVYNIIVIEKEKRLRGYVLEAICDNSSSIVWSKKETEKKSCNLSTF